MKVLGIETSTLTGSVALLNDAELIGELSTSVSLQHSERLMPAIDTLFKSAGLLPSEIDLIAVSHGPGSFTGLRIGIAAAQGLALSLQKPMVGVSSLEALAFNAATFRGLIVPVLNAYRSEVFRGFYRWSQSEGTLEALDEDRPKTIPDLMQELEARKEEVLLLGNGVSLCGDRFPVAPSIFHHPRAANVAFLGLQKWKKTGKEEPVLPRYLRNPGNPG
jgi:tRNA threonylcarbamoyladenosine biosynthesis protein TsaB